MTKKRLNNLLKKLDPPARCKKCKCLLFTPALLCDNCLNWQKYMGNGEVPEYPDDQDVSVEDSSIDSVQVRSFGDTICII